MSEQIAAGEQAPAQQTTDVEAPLSIMEHAAEFGPNRDRTPEPQADLPANATAEQKAAHHSEQQRREKETGKFTEGRKRHRAASQQATAADAPRIQELSRKNRELTEQLAAARQAAPAPAQTTNGTGQTQRQAPPQVAPQRPPQAAAPSFQRVSDPTDPEPKETDKKYTDDTANGPMQYFQDWSRWNVRDENRQLRARDAHQQRVVHQSMQWGQRVEAAMQEMPDYAAVVFQGSPIPWTNGSPIDQFIDGDDNGAKVLYHLQTHLDERDALMQMPALKQLRTLSLLSQRYDSASSSSQASAQAGKTGSAARQFVKIPPKPPNPVRTEAQRVSGGPPPTDGSLSVMSHAKQFRRS